MAKKIFSLFFCFIFLLTHPGLTLADTVVSQPGASHLRVSLLLSGPGVESWSSFGHICIRIIDSTRSDAARDVAYNFGMIDDYDETITHQFLTKRVRASLDTLAFSSLVTEYTETGRQLTEYELILTDEQKTALQAHLKKGLDYNTRFYDYDTFFDNCSTEIRDVFEEVFGKRFIAGSVIPNGAKMTFRNVSFNRYCPQQSKYWFGLGVNIIYAGRIDEAMNNREAAFVPVYLAESISHATIDNKNIYGGTRVLVQERIKWSDDINMPFLISCLVALLTIVSIAMYRKVQWPAVVMGTLVMLTTAAVGCFILYTMWLNGEPSWSRNLNLLWALPTNLAIPLLGSRARRGYALVGMLLIGLALLVSILHIQFIPLLEVGPLLLAALWVYGLMYRCYNQ